MEIVKIKFTDFDAYFEPMQHWVTKTLQKKYRVELTDDPDFLFYGPWGAEQGSKNYGLDHRNYNCVKIFCGGEPVSPDFNECDYAFGFEPIFYEGRYMQYPVGDCNSPGIYNVDKSIQDRSRISEKMFDRKFCNFIYSQDWMGEGAPLRRDFCQALMKYKHVDCPGYILNNMPRDSISTRWTGGACGNGTVLPGWSNGKLQFIKDYKFTIAFENTSFPGYTTEKLVHPFQAYSIPIYWGNPEVAKLFNPEAFVNCNEYDNDFDAIIARIRELDTDREQYLKMLSQPPLQPDFDYHRVEKAEEFLFRIIERGNHPLPKDMIHISTSFRAYEQLQNTWRELEEARAALNQYGCPADSNSWKLLRKMQKFADSKWGYFPKKVFLFLLKIYRKLKSSL